MSLRKRTGKRALREVLASVIGNPPKTPRYRATYHNGPDTAPGVLDQHTGKFHPRPHYSNIDIGNLMRWLNEREGEYSDLNERMT